MKYYLAFKELGIKRGTLSLWQLTVLVEFATWMVEFCDFAFQIGVDESFFVSEADPFQFLFWEKNEFDWRLDGFHMKL